MALFNKVELRAIGQSHRAEAGLYKSANQILVENAAQFSATKTFDIFLSHSSLDADSILGLHTKLCRLGYTVYVDWIEDRDLDRSRVSKQTAARLRVRMINCGCLFYAISPNAQRSIWMPWELGYFDGIKRKVALIPVFEQPDSSDNFRGQEYLGLYPYVTKAPPQGGGSEVLWVHDEVSTYVVFDAWLRHDLSPFRH